jgi:hypothetical protein
MREPHFHVGMLLMGAGCQSNMSGLARFDSGRAQSRLTSSAAGLQNRILQHHGGQTLKRHDASDAETYTWIIGLRVNPLSPACPSAIHVQLYMRIDQLTMLTSLSCVSQHMSLYSRRRLC